MNESISFKRFYVWFSVIATFAAMTLYADILLAASYSESAHAQQPDIGVSRPSIADNGYSRGNCAHCHEQHASVDGTEPEPVDNVPSVFALFTDNFNTLRTSYPYFEEDNICFSCHNESGTAMQVTNYTYAQTFGGFTPTNPINSVMDAFSTALKEGHTEHNLSDIYNYAKSHFSYFKEGSNPCVACHNPHLARRNNSNTSDPTLTVISRPTDHDNLWGDEPGETMADSVGTGTYQPPYFYYGAGSPTTQYEPGGVNYSHDGSKLPDYNTFCLDCHGNSDVYSSVYGRNLVQIDWSSNGDIHGGRPRYAEHYSSTPGYILRAPYNTTLDSTTPNYVLSCLDCHEPHGTVMYNYSGYYSFLLRKEVNGAKVGCYGCGWPLNDADYTILDVCSKCHSLSDGGEGIKHCGSQWECKNCHYHGSVQAAGCGPSNWNKPAF
ncbi:MAG: hypothetical protein KQH63_21445 [Desulfobulbaceae bacterium]|nr:hypothetical protein [Desulfobulbaceae bacterium]